MHNIHVLGAIALLATSAAACLHARREVSHHHNVKRQYTMPTPLSPEEETLVGAVSTTTLDEWSYYYT
jgi:hypothetical protein